MMKLWEMTDGCELMIYADDLTLVAADWGSSNGRDSHGRELNNVSFRKDKGSFF